MIKKIKTINKIENDLNDSKENENINKLKNYIKKLRNSTYGNDKKKIKTDQANLLKIKKEKDMSVYLLLHLKYILIIVQKN